MKFSGKQQLLLSMFGIIVLLFCSYKFSFSKTVEIYQEYHRLRKTGNEESSSASPELLMKHRTLGKRIAQMTIDTSSSENKLISFIGERCADLNLRLQEYSTVNLQKVDSLILITQNISVIGAYTECLQLIYDLESKLQIAKVASVKFKTIKSVSDENSELICSIHIQNVLQ